MRGRHNNVRLVLLPLLLSCASRGDNEEERRRLRGRHRPKTKARLDETNDMTKEAMARAWSAFSVWDDSQKVDIEDQRFLKSTRALAPNATDLIDQSFDYIRSLATYTFAADDWRGVERWIRDGDSLPPVFGVDVQMGPNETHVRAFCAFARYALPRLESLGNVQGFVLSTLGTASRGSPWHPRAQMLLSRECRSGAAEDSGSPATLSIVLQRLLTSTKLQRWFVSQHYPSADLGDRPTQKPLSAWNPVQPSPAYFWGHGKSPVGGTPKLVMVPLGLRDDTSWHAAWETSSLTYNRSKLLLVDADPSKFSVGSKLAEFQVGWPHGCFFRPTLSAAHPTLSAAYFAGLALSKFVMSPPGEGLDDVRHWETIAFGGVPIVEASPVIHALFDGLPHLAVPQWASDKMTPERLLQSYERLLATKASFNFERLTKSFWQRAYTRELELAAKAASPSKMASLELSHLLRKSHCHKSRRRVGLYLCPHMDNFNNTPHMENFNIPATHALAA